MVVDDQKFFYAVFVENFLRLFQSGANGYGDELLFGHHLVDGNVETGFEAQVAVRQNADEFLVFCNRHTGNLVLPHHLHCVRDFIVRRHGDRIHDHAAFRALDLVHFFGLLLNRQIAMHDAESTLLRQGNRHARLGHSIHSCADNGHV